MGMNTSSVVGNRLKRHTYLATITLWLIAVVIHGAWRIYSVLSEPPDPDLYANTFGFQLAAYAFVWLPRFLIVLVCVLLVEFVLFGRKSRSVTLGR